MVRDDGGGRRRSSSDEVRDQSVIEPWSEVWRDYRHFVNINLKLLCLTPSLAPDPWFHGYSYLSGSFRWSTNQIQVLRSLAAGHGAEVGARCSADLSARGRARDLDRDLAGTMLHAPARFGWSTVNPTSTLWDFQTSAGRQVLRICIDANDAYERRACIDIPAYAAIPPSWTSWVYAEYRSSQSMQCNATLNAV